MSDGVTPRSNDARVLRQGAAVGEATSTLRGGPSSPPRSHQGPRPGEQPAGAGPGGPGEGSQRKAGLAEGPSAARREQRGVC